MRGGGGRISKTIQNYTYFDVATKPRVTRLFVPGPDALDEIDVDRLGLVQLGPVLQHPLHHYRHVVHMSKQVLR